MKAMQPELVCEIARSKKLILGKIEDERILYLICIGIGIIGLIIFLSISTRAYDEGDSLVFLASITLPAFIFIVLVLLFFEKRRLSKINSHIMGYFDERLITRVAVYDMAHKIREDLVNSALKILLKEELGWYETAEKIKYSEFKPLFSHAKYTDFIVPSEGWSVFFDLAKERKDLWDDLWNKIVPLQ